MKSKVTTLLKENIHNVELCNFIKNNKLTDNNLEPYYELLVQYITSYNLCKTMKECSQNVKGYRYKLNLVTNDKINLILTDCLHSINKIVQQQVSNNFLIRHYDDKLLSLSWTKNFSATDPARKQIVQRIKSSLKQTNYQALYLHGDTGTGKTFIFILLANQLVKNKTVCFIVWPEFVMNIKKSFKNETGNTNDLQIEQLKTCDLLFIDDLGGETVSAWERDELLFSILNARVLPLKTTFINSNYSINELDQHYRLRNGKSEEIKVKRLLERIKTLTYPIHLTKEITIKKQKVDNQQLEINYEETF